MFALILINNTIWEDKNISVLSSSTQEACKAACLQDCNCDAAQFKQGECKKQSLPLRFGRLFDDPNRAFIKVSISTPTTARNVAKKRKKEVLIISVSLVAFAFIVLVIFGIVRYGYRVFACKKESNHGNIVE